MLNKRNKTCKKVVQDIAVITDRNLTRYYQYVEVIIEKEYVTKDAYLKYGFGQRPRQSEGNFHVPKVASISPGNFDFIRPVPLRYSTLSNTCPKPRPVSQ